MGGFLGAEGATGAAVEDMYVAYRLSADVGNHLVVDDEGVEVGRLVEKP